MARLTVDVTSVGILCCCPSDCGSYVSIESNGQASYLFSPKDRRDIPVDSTSYESRYITLSARLNVGLTSEGRLADRPL